MAQIQRIRTIGETAAELGVSEAAISGLVRAWKVSPARVPGRGKGKSFGITPRVFKRLREALNPAEASAVAG